MTIDLDGPNTPLIRTDYSNEAAWLEVVAATNKDWEDGFRAQVTIVNDPDLDGWIPERLLLLPQAKRHSVLLIADSTTMHDCERLVLCVDPSSRHKPFRVVLPELWSVENNLSLANMDYDEFLRAAIDGVFRGFD